MSTDAPAPSDPEFPWHARPVADALAAQATDGQGLSGLEAQRRRDHHGANRLEQVAGPGVLRRLARQFNNLLLYVLMAAGAVTAALGHWIDTGVILAVVVINAVIGFVQEGKAERALQAIRHLLAPRATVRRDGRQHDIDAADLVPGDLVLLAPGDIVPADLRLLTAHNLRIDEAALTGESVPVDKHTEPVAVDAGLGDRLCLAFAGTLVTQGQARALVVATGAATEIGRIGRMLAAVEQDTTPLLRKMAGFGRVLTFVILALAAVLFAFGIGVRGVAAGEMFMVAVGLAVAAIPEALPAIMTITLAIGVQRMAARHAVIRRLPAVEALGAVTVICSDKTGTLTRNEMTVQQMVCAGQVLDVGGAGYAPEGAISLDGAALDRGQIAAQCPAAWELAEAGALCNDASLHEFADTAVAGSAATPSEWRLTGDPTEGALLTLALKSGLDLAERQLARPRSEVIPFDSDYRFMATLHQGDDNGGGGRAAIAYVKGAPERVLGMCSRVLAPDGTEQPLDRAHWDAQVDAQAGAGRRVLALARRRWPEGRQDLDHADIAVGMTLLGLVGIIDPPREEAIRAVAECHAAGIRVVMITGDHGATASAIAAQLGMGHRLRAVTGPELQAADDAELRRLVADTAVFGRASPEHKLRLVRALKANGEIVAMTGDGVNDAPALKQADVGVAMGRKGTEAAKQAASIVLTDDNFASIAQAVAQGRTVYDNLRKTITFILPVNGGESLSLLVAVLLGVALPIAPVQILWVNMVSSLALALALAFEPPEADVMRRPPRPPDEPMLSGFLVWRVVFVSTLFLVGIFGMFEWAVQRGAGLEEARTVAINTLVAMEVFYLFSVRYLKAPSFTLQGVKGTPRVLMAVALVALLQLLFTYAPFMQAWFDTRPLSLSTGLHIVAAGGALLVLLEIEKALIRRSGHAVR